MVQSLKVIQCVGSDTLRLNGRYMLSLKGLIPDNENLRCPLKQEFHIFCSRINNTIILACSDPNAPAPPGGPEAGSGQDSSSDSDSSWSD